ncbi:hypothetical protein SPRG_10914 [Saprolegnia parasitica CBS 223.65]|uniref:Uncharacterized protein n=1 Tax=Saprolegnia parasitica (strain CBS 223.65) TaxID=695850 RepID=A0A067CC67_SAPPC|nr:hypothetical protein SPRG_10914 [Saprolegnia parasitica CBS 223.65]KDO24126.1 hypothetical protein SPRG_10914 [Saprolegnia parasitica CBS 223.65]|eukprot:XP_012205261.1 hypothetical protein SPRG_10914 [Saprolegnia parasitica CBS 223.65]
MLMATMVSVINHPLAQQEALVSLAECVLRSEKAAGLARLEAMSVEDERRLLLSRVDSEAYVAIAIGEGPSLHDHVAALRSELADARVMQAASQATLEQLVALVHAWKKDKSS